MAKKPIGTTMQLRNIADTARIPQDFLAKTFQKLSRANIVATSRGAIPGGAFVRRANAINLKDIFLAVGVSHL